MQDSYFYKKVKAYTQIILFYLETYLAATNQNSVVIDMLDGMQDEIEKIADELGDGLDKGNILKFIIFKNLMTCSKIFLKVSLNLV